MSKPRTAKPVSRANPHRPRSRAASLARHGDPASLAVPVRVDAARLARFNDLMHTIATARRDEARGFDRYWEAVGEIINAELYVAGGHATADAFLRATVEEPPRTALRMVRVARYASPDDEARYGVARLDAALAYLEAKNGGSTRGHLPVRFDALRVDVPRGRSVASVPLADATVADLRAATRALLRHTQHARVRSSPTEQQLSETVAGIPGLEGVSVHVHDGKVRFGEVPLFALPALGHALASYHTAAPPVASAAVRRPASKRAARKQRRAPR